MKLQQISDIRPTLGFTEFNFLEKYRESFAVSELGRIREQLPLKEIAEKLYSHNRRRHPQGNKPMFPPEGEVALMFLKPYTGLSDEGLIEMLNGSVHMQMFCGVLIDPSHPIKDGKIVSAIRNRLSQLVADIIYESDAACEQRQMTVNNQLPDILVIKGNRQLLYSIFRNLMDNAINYAGTGAIIGISAVETTRHWRFTFSDTGHGIADEHLPHIFERFYRVDKGRSRAMGGTGLGLAIVKNAVLHHGGNIQALRNQSGGLTIEFTLHK